MPLKRILLCLTVSFLFSFSLAFSQNEASIGGTVMDSSNAAIPSATVTLTSQEQGTVRTAQTNASGVYQFSFLPSGGYRIDILATGFKPLSTSGIVIAVAQAVRRDFRLEVGATAETVTVSGTDNLLSTDDATIGTVINNKKVVEMPLNGRLFYSLAALTPGVMPAAQNSTNSTRGGFNIFGSCDVCNNYTLNGMFNNNLAVGSVPAVRPSIDSIQEFNILTGIYSAQYGYGSGGQIITTTKSGTNQFHGVVFEFLRNQAMDARNYFSAPGPLPSFKRNQFGGAIGGPIQKDKTFFFFSYEGLRLTQGISSLATYPTEAMHTGDFSGISRAIKNPATGKAFAGNQIPQNMISPIGQAIINLYPAPNIQQSGSALPSNNYAFQVTRPEDYNSFSLKIDHTFSQKDSAFATGNYYNDISTEAGATLTAGCTPYYLPQFTCNSSSKSQIYEVAETHVFSASLVNEARIGLTLNATENYPSTAHTDFWGPFGIQPLISPTPSGTRVPTYGYPNTSITGYTTFGSGNVAYYHIPVWDFSDSVSWTRGKHTLKMGVDVIHIAANNINLGSQAGTLSFTNTSTGPTSGYGIADLLLGLPASSGNTPYKYQLYIRSASPSLYVQDDFKVSSALTLNLGLRWETNTPVITLANNLASFDPSTGLPTVQANYAPIPSEIAIPFEVLKTHSIWNSDWRDYSPRLGFAWQPVVGGKTVVRGGFGTFFNNNTVLNNISSFPGAVPYTVNNTYSSSAAQPLLLSNPFSSTSAVTSNSPVGVNPNFRNPRAYEWSLGVQRSITKDIVAEVAYAGSSGANLQSTQNINQPAPGPGTPAQVKARRPYPNFGTITYTEFSFRSNFQQLQAKVTKSFGGGLSFLGSYVYSHSIDDLGTLTNQYDVLTGRGSSNFDVRHRVVISAVWDLPFGPGKEMVSHGVASQIVGGWQVSPLLQWQTGIPLTATLSGNYSNTGGTTDRPNIIGNPNSGAPHNAKEWFNTAAFQVPIASGQPGAQYTFGNEGRGPIVGPGLINLDLALSRNFKIWEGVEGHFRGEFFDIFNHPNFGIPNLVADGGPSFGTISSTVTPQNQSGGANRTVQVALKISF